MPDRTTLAYLYDGTFEGLLTVIFEAYARRPMPDAVWAADGYQPLFGQEAVEIAADPAKAARVVAGIQKKMGADAYERVWLAFLSEQPERGQWIYDYVRLGMTVGPRIGELLTDDRVIRLHKWSGLVSLESARLIQFVRFSKREGGVYYSGIQPAYDVVAMLMPHFVERLNIQPFIIHDKKRNIFGVFDTRDWYITQTDDVTLPAVTAEEKDYRRLWKTFYDTVAIKERLNPRCQRQHMPKKYWKEITELLMDAEREEREECGSPVTLAPEKPIPPALLQPRG